MNLVSDAKDREWKLQLFNIEKYRTGDKLSQNGERKKNYFSYWWPMPNENSLFLKYMIPTSPTLDSSCNELPFCFKLKRTIAYMLFFFH